jgi:hypothetical protein
MVRGTVEGAGGFEERRRGQRFKLALPVQLNDGTGTTRDISTSGIFFETVSGEVLWCYWEERLNGSTGTDGPGNTPKPATFAIRRKLKWLFCF